MIYRALVLLLASSISGFLVGALDIERVKQPGDISSTTYGVIVDCGSSGTRAHIFEWDSTLQFPQLLNDIDPMRDAKWHPISKKIKPGLSSLKDTPEKASEYMKPLMDFITSKIPAKALSSTGIFIMGTAGMRLLDSDTQMSIMDDIARDLERNYNFAKIGTSVISGTYEGLYTWITVNSKAKRFLTAGTNSLTGTFGIIEMGGASLQVSFQIQIGMCSRIRAALGDGSEALKAFEAHVVEPHISRQATKHNYRIFSASFLGFGSNSAREAFVDLLIKANKNNRFTARSMAPMRQSHSSRFQHSVESVITLEDPCLPRGSIETLKKPKRMLTTTGQTIGFTLAEDEPTFRVRLVGTGNYFKCHMLVKAMLVTANAERMNCKPNEPCPMVLLGTPFAPFDSTKYLGLAEFYYTTKEMMGAEGIYRRKKVLDKTKTICSTSYSDLLATYPNANKHDPTRVILECFKAVWIDVFLTDGLKMPDDSKNLQTIGQIKGDSLDWTLGAVIDKSLTIEKAAEDNGHMG